MRCSCPACHAELTYEGEPPRFCSRCGSSLQQVITAALDATDAYQPTGETALLTGVASNSAAPDQIGGYQLLKKLGAGGMGAVYEAQDLASGQRVALKLIKRGASLSDSAAQRFRQEGRLASSITHPRCVFVLAADEDQGKPFIVMELMPGPTLADLVRQEGPLPASKAVALIYDVIEGLQEAHRLGLVHRDVKPANCFLDENGRAKIGDFGLAKVLDHHETGDAPTAIALTGTGTFLGTPLYAAPEQIKGYKVDQQVDVYAVGATLYYLLSGKAPFEEQQSVTAVLARIVSEDPEPIQRQDLPTGLEAVVFQAMQRDRSKRFRDLETLRQALLAYLPGRSRIVRIGLRFTAILVDLFLGFLILTTFALGLGWLLSSTGITTMQGGVDILFDDALLSSVLSSLLLHSLVFLLPESLWGRTLGKWLFRLRLSDPEVGGIPRFRKVLIRTAIFMLATNLVFWVVLLFQQRMVPSSTTNNTIAQQSLKEDHSWKITMGEEFLGILLGAALLASTMRRSNGYRGLHEILSGTATIWLPAPPPRSILPQILLNSAVPQEARPLAEPLVMGNFTLSHELWQNESGAVYADRDEKLARPVWLWLHADGIPNLEQARRTVSRPTRWRWLACGAYAGKSWDAFLATPGISLTTLLSQGHKLDWPATYHLLVELCEEMRAARQDNTTVPIMAPQQVWIQQRGCV
ncbi:MAG TPA: protein kinase, partial [Gemmatales bacterium]|nr:protein kinase [Gemmatales bacterium]